MTGMRHGAFSRLITVLAICMPTLRGLARQAGPRTTSRLGDEEIPSSMVWRPDGSYTAVTTYTPDATDGGNSGPVLDLAGVKAVVQTFRCPGSRLLSVSGHVGVPGLDHAPSPLTFAVRRGPRGRAVVQRQVTPNTLTPGGHWIDLDVSLDCEAGSEWQLVITVDRAYTEAKRMHLFRVVPDSPRRAPWVVGGHVDDQPLDTALWMRMTYQRRKAGLLGPGRVFWSLPSERNITVDLARSAEAIASDSGAPVNLTAARDEAVSQWFGVAAAPAEHGGVYDLLVTDLRHESGEVVARHRAAVEWLRHAAVYWRSSRDGIFSDPLAPRASARPDPIDAPSNVAFLVTWRPPADTRPGTYRGRVALQADGHEVGRRDVALRVLGYRLPWKKTFQTALFGGFSGEIHPAFQLDYPDRYGPDSMRVRRWFFDALAHSRIALSNLIMWHPQFLEQDPPPGYTAATVYASDFLQQAVIDAGRMLNRAGFDASMITPWHDVYAVFDGDESAKPRISVFWQTYYPLLQREGWVDQSWTRLKDEFSSVEEATRARAFVDWLRPQVPGLRIMATSMWFHEAPRHILAEHIDIWCPTVEEYLHFRPFYRERLAAGDQVWPYIHFHALLNRDELALRTYFWWLYAEGLDGCCYYSVGPRGQQVARPYGIRQASDMPWGDGSILWGAPRELWRSVRLTRIGDGIEEWEKLTMLEALAAPLVTDGDAAPAIADEVARFRRAVDAAFAANGCCRLDLAGFDRLRQQLDGLIERLTGTAGPP